MVLRIAVVGAGPGGLFLAGLLARDVPHAQVTVYERNAAEDTFGFGVVFSDATLRAIDEADPVLRDGLLDHGVHWDRIEVWSGGERHGFGGNGMAAIHRRTLLTLLQRNAIEAGATVHFSTEAPDLETLRAEHDLVVGADGTNSAVRRRLEEHVDLGHTVEEAEALFIWFGTTYAFDGLTFVHRSSEHGPFAVHGYPIGRDLSTFIVETDADTWKRAGLDAFDTTAPPGTSDARTQAYLEELFAPDVDGHRLVANNSRWGHFRTRRTRRWHHEDVVLLGDAVHTAHFSVGSGTKMAMEDALVLARVVAGIGDEPTPERVAAALEEYEQVRRPAVARIQDAAGPSLAWWERFGRYREALDPRTFAFHFFSRSIAVDKMAQRDPGLVDDVRAAARARLGSDVLDSTVEVGGTPLPRRLVLRGDLLTTPDGATSVPVAVVEAPETERELEAVGAALPDGGAVAVVGGTALTRVLLAEEARMHHGLVSVLVEDVDDAALETLLLAGRADAVATEER